MLAAMGYQPGQGLGAREQGEAEPLAVQPLRGRLGLGATSRRAAKQGRTATLRAAARAAAAQQELDAVAGRDRLRRDFRRQVSGRAAAGRALRALANARRVRSCVVCVGGGGEENGVF